MAKICSLLKLNKARDENGIVYELFKPKYAGPDIYQSLTLLFNSMKNNLQVPDFMQHMTITSIFKNKGSKLELKNERGIFNLQKG